MGNLPRFIPYLILALICGTASVLIVFIAMMALAHGGRLTDSGMYAIAAMAFAPALLGVGIAAYMPQDRL
jgi:hypothetical protein